MKVQLVDNNTVACDNLKSGHRGDITARGVPPSRLDEVCGDPDKICLVKDDRAITEVTLVSVSLAKLTEKS